MKVCIVGGGHIGTTLACYIKKQNPDKTVNLLTRKPQRFCDRIKVNDVEQEVSYEVILDTISQEPSETVSGAQIIFIALPHNAVEQAFRNISPYVDEGAYIGVIPGCGGCEFYFNKYFNRDNVLFGFQRVPFTAKLVEYGKETNLKSWKPYSVVGTLKRDCINEVCECIESCGLKTVAADNYLEIALTPSNPILHTSRTYELFHAHEKDYVFSERMKFYVGWTDYTSEIMLKMDDELHKLLDEIDVLRTDLIKPLSEHYESYSIKAMTEKINSIQTFQSVYAPLVEVQGKGYVADTSSRLFTEDFAWGLLIYRAYFEYFNVQAPVMDSVLKWFSGYVGLDWYENDKLCGRDLADTGIPQRYGIETREQLLDIYLQ